MPHPTADVVLSLTPLAVLIYLMGRRQSMRASRALPLAAVMVYLIQLGWFATRPDLVHAAILDGLLTAATPILIVTGAILLFKTMEASGAMQTLREWINGISDNRVAQVMIVGWAFSFLMEGASGFGTPAALAAPILVGLGVAPVRSAIVCLVMNSVPVSFGAVGTPTWFGFGQLGLTSAELREVAINSAVMHAAAAMVIPLMALAVVVPWREVRRNVVFIYLSIFSCVIPYVLLARVSYEFPAVGGGFVGLLVTIFLARRRVGLAGDLDRDTTPTPTQIRPAGLVKALFPIWGTVLILLVTRIEQLGVKPLLTAASPAVEFTLGSLGVFRVSPAGVVQLRNILQTDTHWSHALLYVPSILPFGLVVLISLVWFRVDRDRVFGVVRDTVASVREPTVALLGALVLVKLFMTGQDKSAAAVLGTTLAATAGNQWPYVATLLGALGSFFTGSNTVSNLTFGPIQDTIATELNLPRGVMLALQSAGGALGNMVCIHNIVAVCSILGLQRQEGVILRRTVLAMLVYALVVSAVGAVLLMRT